MFPEEWKESDAEADFDLVDDHASTRWRRRSAPASAEQAEQARLSAYAFFEFGPELQLRALDPRPRRPRSRG